MKKEPTLFELLSENEIVKVKESDVRNVRLHELTLAELDHLSLILLRDADVIEMYRFLLHRSETLKRVLS